MFPKILFTLSNAWFFIFRVISILFFAGFVSGVLLQVSNNIVSSDPYFPTYYMLSGFLGAFTWANSRGFSRWIVGLVEYPLDYSHKAFRADLLGG